MKAGRPTTNEQVDLYKSDAANFKFAHARALAHGDATTALRFVRCLGRVWYRLGPFAESYSLARASLALRGGADVDRAYALLRAAYFAVHLGGELEAARDLLSEAESLFTRLDDRMGLAEVLSCRAARAAKVGDYDEAVAAAEKQSVLARELGDADIARLADLRLGDILSFRAIEHEDRADATRSRAIFKSRQQELPELASRFEETILYSALAVVEFALGDYAETISLCRQGLLAMLDLGVERAPDKLLTLGWAVGARGEAALGVTLVSAALREYREDGFELERWERVQMERFERASRHALGDDGYEAAAREGEALSDAEANQLALSVTTAAGT